MYVLPVLDLPFPHGDGALYTGITTDLSRRCRQPNEGKAARYTRTRRPTRLIFQEEHPDKGSALRREAAIKAVPRRRKEALIRQARRKAS